MSNNLTGSNNNKWLALHDGDTVPDTAHLYKANCIYAMLKLKDQKKHDCIFSDQYCNLKETNE